MSGIQDDDAHCKCSETYVGKKIRRWKIRRLHTELSVIGGQVYFIYRKKEKKTARYSGLSLRYVFSDRSTIGLHLWRSRSTKSWASQQFVVNSARRPGIRYTNTLSFQPFPWQVKQFKEEKKRKTLARHRSFFCIFSRLSIGGEIRQLPYTSCTHVGVCAFVSFVRSSVGGLMKRVRRIK